MKVATFNIHKHKTTFGKKVYLSDDYFFNLIDLDVICLQECLIDQSVFDYFSAKGFDVFFLPLRFKKHHWFGNVTIVKKHFNAHLMGFKLLKSTKFENRGVLSVRVNNVIIFNTHLSLMKQVAKKQIINLKEYERELNCKNHPWLCAGDFNMFIRSKKILETYQCVQSKSFPSKLPMRKIDGFIYKNLVECSLEAVSCGNNLLSDHLPVIIRIKYEK